MQDESSKSTGLMCGDGTTSPHYSQAVQNGKLTSFAVGSPAKTSAQPESVQDSTATEAAYSSRPFAWLSYSDLDGFCWRTWQACLIEDWTRYSERWPRSGLMQNGTVYKLPTLARRISGTGCSFWRTPTPTEAGNKIETLQTKDGAPAKLGERAYRVNEDGSKTLQGQTLSQQVRYRWWVTPTAVDGNRGNKPARPHDTGVPLSQQVVMPERFPTPHGLSGSQGQGGDELDKAIRQTSPNGGQLNPTWVEWLMGFPLGWTACEESETR